MSPETESTLVLARLQSRHLSGPPPCRSEPGDSAAGPGGARRRVRRRRRVGICPETEPPLVRARRRSLECVGVIGGMGAKGAKIRDAGNMWKRYSPHKMVQLAK